VGGVDAEGRRGKTKKRIGGNLTRDETHFGARLWWGGGRRKKIKRASASYMQGGNSNQKNRTIHINTRTERSN